MKRSNDNDQNFWISYADLMAGLLFVFILLIGAIVVKYVYTQSNLNSKKHQLEQKKKVVNAVTDKLITTEDALKAMRALLVQEQERNVNANEIIRLREEELISLKDKLLENKESLKGERDTVKSLNVELNQSKETIRITKDELAKINQKLLESASAHQKLIEDLNITKARINNLTGIRIKAIKVLKRKLGNAIKVDSKSGSIRLPSAVLFDVDAYRLKNSAKKDLRSTLIKYINALLKDEEIRNYIDGIVIEGYTDSSGSYLYNLGLSQKRAFSVLEFLHKQKGVSSKLLKKYVSASGKAYSNVIMKDGKEDKEASRRIEVKFNISNKKAIKEIDTFLKSNHK